MTFTHNSFSEAKKAAKKKPDYTFTAKGVDHWYSEVKYCSWRKRLIVVTRSTRDPMIGIV